MSEHRSGGHCLLILCGLPASGKTRLAKSILDQCIQVGHETNENTCNGKNLYCVHVEYDELLSPEIEKDILTTVRQGEYEESEWKSYRSDILTCVETLVKITTERRTRIEFHNDISLSQILVGVIKPDTVRPEVWERFTALVGRQTGFLSREDVVCFIIDDNMYYRSMRYMYYQLARKYAIGFCQCCLAVPADQAIVRNRDRQAPVDDSIIRTMEGRLQIPDGEINGWEKMSVVFKETPDCIDDVIKLVREASDKPVLMPEEVDWELKDQAREVCSTNFHHQADQIMRRIISTEMSSSKGGGDNALELKELASKLQEKRRTLLHDLKTGAQLVPSDINNVKDDSKDSDSRLFKFIKELFYEPKVA